MKYFKDQNNMGDERTSEMKNKLKILFLCLFSIYILFVSSACRSEQARMSFTVSMEEPDTHMFQVELLCKGIEGDTVDFKIPSWTPGYYRVLDFEKNVRNFSAQDQGGQPLEWEKTGENVWHVQTGDAKNIVLYYQVYAAGRGVAESSLDTNRGYISPTGVFLYIAGKLGIPATVTVNPYKNFSKISTGLDAVKGKENTFLAKNFDNLYDCPIFVDNQEVISFTLSGKEHRIALYEPGEVDKEKLVSVLKRMVRSAVSIVNEIPYDHYTFIMMGPGMGGLEHSNSMAVFTKLPKLEEPQQYNGWLSFIAHEFFHLYNVKSIRPKALGPFDYDKENRTNMLWLSEGGTVYYEYIILNRAGFMNRDDVLDRLSGIIKRYELSPANKTMSVAEASFDTWTLPFFGGDKTISYYDKGAGLCLLLDLKIRHETGNKKFLDDVMRECYRKYFKKLKRGFTDEEFQEECEAVAGCSLDEFFEYVYTTKAIDYGKYLGYAGMKIEITDEGEEGSVTIEKIDEPDALQKKILENWLK
jgi:predicted metalloprotease with PDZ domain